MTSAAPLLIGFSASVYVRMALLAALEKGVTLAREALDPFQPAGPPPALLALNPFGKVPVLRHGALLLYETQAITAYLDEAFPGPALQPADPVARARLRQILGIVDAHAYRPLVWDLYVAGHAGRPLEAALPAARRVLDALEGLAAGPWLLGGAPSLADCHLAPPVRYLIEAPGGPALLAERPGLAAWWARCRARPGWAAVLVGEGT